MLYGDFESRREVELSREKSVGMHNYMTHPSTQPVMFGYALDNDTPKLWRMWEGEPMPVEVRERLDDPKEPLCFFNSAFERYMFQFKLGITLDINRIVDPQVSCRYLSLPGSLEDASDILGLDHSDPLLAGERSPKGSVALPRWKFPPLSGRGAAHWTHRSRRRVMERRSEWPNSDTRERSGSRVCSCFG